MTLASKLIATFLGGFIVHQSAPLIDILAPGWKNLTSYGVGVLTAMPFGIAINEEFHDIPDSRKRFAVAFLTTFFFYGAGTAIGYIFSTVSDSLHPIRRN